jgi:hypothetical protein
MPKVIRRVKSIFFMRVLYFIKYLFADKELKSSLLHKRYYDKFVEVL